MADDPLRFIQVGELVKGISEGTLPADDGLAGRTLTLAAEDGTVHQAELRARPARSRGRSPPGPPPASAARRRA